MTRAEVALEALREEQQREREEIERLVREYNEEQAGEGGCSPIKAPEQGGRVVPFCEMLLRDRRRMDKGGAGFRRGQSLKGFKIAMEGKLEGEGSAMELGQLVRERDELRALDKERRTAMLAERRKAEEQVSRDADVFCLRRVGRVLVGSRRMTSLSGMLLAVVENSLCFGRAIGVSRVLRCHAQC